MNRRDDSEKKHVNISITQETSRKLKALAAEKDSNVSQVITDWVWDISELNEEPYKSKALSLSPDTFFRLQTWAQEHHTTPEQAVTDWVWKQKVKDPQIRGQMRFA